MISPEVLKQKYNVDPADIEKALQFKAKFGGMLGSILINMGVISEEALVSVLSAQLELKSFKEVDRNKLNFKNLPLDQEINMSFLLKRHWLPFEKATRKILFFTTYPIDSEVIQYLEDRGVEWDICLVTISQFRELEGEYNLSQGMNQLGSVDASGMMDVEIDKLRELASEAPIVNLVNSFISRAVGARASDLHFEPFKNMYRVRFRIDGILRDIDFLPIQLQIPISSRIKILAGMDIAERRRPQDGQISLKVSSKKVDLRVSSLPLAHGESIVVRFLIKESIDYGLEHLGLEPDLTAALLEDISSSSGVILLTGPTGSGKTTTLYSCLNKISNEEIKIITVEDPVEYQFDGINQIQVQPGIGYDFPSALRSILRQDPDVIMVGEIRDAETARIGMQASLTGHLVFSTLHTNSAATAYTRLIDLGIEEYLINSSLISVIAQRLVRKVCQACGERKPLDKAIIEAHGLKNLAARYNLELSHKMEAKGCPVCNHTGYVGRVGIMEYLRCTDQVKAIPKGSGFSIEAAKYMKSQNIRSLAEDGFLKALKGVTTIEEILRVCN